MSQKPLILISNDDGFEAPGIRNLIEFVEPIAQVIAIAPMGQSSGKSASITVGTPLTIVRKPDISHSHVWAVSGTPVDCVKLGIHTVLSDYPRPSMMLSGINHGSNTGNSTIYSGTMGAATEATEQGIPSVGFSLLNHRSDADFSACKPIVQAIVSKLLNSTLPNKVCLNVNIPDTRSICGVKICRAANGHWTDEYIPITSPDGETIYKLAGEYVNDEPDSIDTDLFWLERNYASVVPVTTDHTSMSSIPYITSLIDGIC